MERYWLGNALFITLFSAFTLCTGLAYICMLTLGMQVCNRTIAATTFTLITAAEPIGAMTGVGLVLTMQCPGGQTAMLAAAAIAFALAGATVLFLTEGTGRSTIRNHL